MAEDKHYGVTITCCDSKPKPLLWFLWCSGASCTGWDPSELQGTVSGGRRAGVKDTKNQEVMLHKPSADDDKDCENNKKMWMFVCLVGGNCLTCGALFDFSFHFPPPSLFWLASHESCYVFGQLPCYLLLPSRCCRRLLIAQS